MPSTRSSLRYSLHFHPTTMAKGKGKKRAATDSQEPTIAAKDRCVWSPDDVMKLVEYVVQHHAKGGDGVNLGNVMGISNPHGSWVWVPRGCGWGYALGIPTPIPI